MNPRPHPHSTKQAGQSSGLDQKCRWTHPAILESFKEHSARTEQHPDHDLASTGDLPIGTECTDLINTSIDV